MTEIQLYNTRTRTKERFEPLTPGQVRMYVCGPTVYDRAHIGNARPVVVFDVLYRLMRHVYGDDAVTYVRNFTDVDDKIIARAQETLAEGETLEAACHRITGETIGWYHEDMNALGALRPDHEPRCTEYIPDMVAMIERLIERGCAYEAEGHVLFDVATYPDYGKLARRSLDDMVAGARVEVAPYKRNATDFVLWKPSTPDQPGWDSPWGRGRPGWHIECSAMAEALLGETFDIHAGGIDLMFPHHENEVAQSCCANRTEVMANFWMHNGFLQVEGEKMAKSLGNFFTVRDLLDRFEDEFAIENIGPAIRLKLMQGRYREPIDFSVGEVEQAAIKLGGWANLFDENTVQLDENESRHLLSGTPFLSALCDDLNTSEALAEIEKLYKVGSGPVAPVNPQGFVDATQALGEADLARRQLQAALELLGFSIAEIRALRHERWSAKLKERMLSGRADISTRIEALLAERQAARKGRDFARADAIRDGLIAAGVTVKDTPQGTEWELAPDFEAAKLPEPSDD